MVQFTKKIDIINDDTPNNKETKIHKAKIRRNIREKQQQKIIIVRYIKMSLRTFYQVQKNNRSILNFVINNLNIIDFYLY